MTIVAAAYDPSGDRVYLAADHQITLGSEFVLADDKIFQTHDSWYGVAGEAAVCDEFRTHMQTGGTFSDLRRHFREQYSDVSFEAIQVVKETLGIYLIDSAGGRVGPTKAGAVGDGSMAWWGAWCAGFQRGYHDFMVAMVATGEAVVTCSEQYTMHTITREQDNG